MAKRILKPQEDIWKTKDGKSLRICDMKDSHLLNSIKLFEDKEKKYHLLPKLKLEAKYRGINWRKIIYNRGDSKGGIIDFKIENLRLNDYLEALKEKRKKMKNKFRLLRLN